MLGNGKQRKSYLYIGDCLDAMLLAMEKTRRTIEVYNLGTNEYVEVNDSIGWICERLGITPAIEYTGGDRGWIGDNPFIFLDNAKMRGAGLDAEADHPRRHHPDARVPAAESGAARGARMKVAVLGCWHLGSVTAACIAAAGHDVVGYDPDATAVAGLNAGRPPIGEPGLADLVAVRRRRRPAALHHRRRRRGRRRRHRLGGVRHARGR